MSIYLSSHVDQTLGASRVSGGLGWREYDGQFRVDIMCPYLSVYPNKSIADELKNGIRFGLYLHYEGPRISTTCTNSVSLKNHPIEVKEKMIKKLLWVV